MKRIIAIVVAMVLVMAPLSICCTAQAAEPVVSEWIVEIIWETLKAWGIEVIENQSEEVKENVYRWINGELDEYLEDELHQTFDRWITGVDWIYDNYGRRMLNALGVQHFWMFAQWLKTKYELQNNDSITVVSPATTINGLVCYDAPLRINSNRNSVQDRQYVEYTASQPCYLIITQNSEGNWRVLSWSEYNTTMNVVTYTHNTNNVTNTTSYNLSLKACGLYLNDTNGLSKDYFNMSGLTYYSYSSVLALFNSSSEPEVETSDSQIDIDTGVITFPSDDPSYTNGDAIIYYSDGSIAYVDIEWPSTISVDNLPAVISPSGTQDPGFSQAFLPIRAFVNTFHDSMDIMRDIVYRLPSQVVTVFMFIFGVTAIFGALHMFKEH